MHTNFIIVVFALLASCAQPCCAFRVAVLIVGQPKVEDPIIIESIRTRIIEPLHAQGHLTDVALCETLHLKDAWAEMTLERLQPYFEFDLNATNQLERVHKCSHKLHESTGARYDWFIKTRPDLILWENVPPLETLNASKVHARLLSAVNITGLKYGSFNTAFNNAGCNPDACTSGPCSTACAVYDDQLAVVGGGTAAHAFLHAFEHTEGATECGWPQGGFPEHHFTRAVLRGGGVFEPLTLEARLWKRLGANYENVPLFMNAKSKKEC